MKTKRQFGFSAVEGIIILVVVSLLATGGYWAFMRDNKTDNNKQTQTTASAEQTAPTIDKTSDLDTAEQALDQTEVDSAGTDSAELETLSNGF